LRNIVRPIAIGCMRLSTEPDRDDDRSIGVLHAALDAGVTFLDTADVYCWTDDDLGHNERLIARALAAWGGDRAAITVATKGGLTRPMGRWEPDGRAKHLALACERSCRALGVATIDLYQLHAPDPAVPLATSIRALDKLQRSGLIKTIGLSNVTVGQIEDARRITEISAIQVELSVWHDASILNGVADYCLTHRLQLLAHRPLGGRKLKGRVAADSTLRAIADRHGVTPFEIALAWLCDLNPGIVPLPGVTRVETAHAAAVAQQLALTDDDRDALDRRFVAGSAIRNRSRLRPPERLREDAEVVIVMGLPGAGKTTYAQPLVDAGYQRLNRDDTGGALVDLLPALDLALAAPAPRVVLDNTYLSRKSRAEVIRVAQRHRAPVRCVWLNTSLEDAQFNAAWRIVSRYGRLPDEDELTELRKTDVQAFAPMAQFRAQRELEPPDPAEGFSNIDIVPFQRRLGPEYLHEALIVWCEDMLVRSKAGARTPSNPDDVIVDDDCAEMVRAHHAKGVRVLGLSWQPEIAARSRQHADVRAVFARVNEITRVPMTIDYCPHAAGPPRCWCRKPLPGLGVLLIHRHHLDPARCLYLGAGAQDPGYARKLGFRRR
jgi:aryl-alcohol dehydrogenase-like predicted oxidoreductase/predicted kinase/histidinol phosphatase-like enzyme